MLDEAEITTKTKELNSNRFKNLKLSHHMSKFTIFSIKDHEVLMSFACSLATDLDFKAEPMMSKSQCRGMFNMKIFLSYCSTYSSTKKIHTEVKLLLIGACLKVAFNSSIFFKKKKKTT